jgi:hypothetical protein
VNPNEILAELRRLVDPLEIEVTPLLPDSGFKSAYEPINIYLDQLQKGTKPETAAEGLFRPLAEVFFDARALPQVGLGSGFVDFKLDAKEESSIVIELKPLFHSFSAELLKSHRLESTGHRGQVKKYLEHSEYLILTDLRDAYLYSARDIWQGLTPFKQLPFADLLESALERRSLLDVVRDAEDGEVRPDLDRAFFKDLQDWFRAFEPVRFKDPAKHDELVIQILNQLIFAKTMEDYSLVRYRQLQDDWERAKEKWKAKGAHRIVWQFLKDFEEFFEDYYDTELFERSIWEELDLDPKNLDRFARLLEAVLGVDEWSKTFQRGIVHYNYRLIDEDIFGKSYEMFLAANRKDEGIFYTPAGITVPMTASLVASLFGPLVAQICDAASAGKADFVSAEPLMAQLARIAIGDTAGGSGGFLIKVLRAVWEQYQRIDQATLWVKNWQSSGDLMNTPPNVQSARAFRERWNFDNRRVLVAQILLRHIFAVDKDAGAIEVAKTNLWKEAVKLSRDDYNFRNLTGDINRTLPSLRLNFVCADSLVDTDPEKQVAYLTEVCGDAMKKLCALREQYIANPSNHAPLEEALKLSAKLRENLTEHFQGESLPAPPLFIALSFFPAWFNADGSARVARADSGVAPESSLNKSKLDEQASGATPAAARATHALPNQFAGFDGIIGNPPWEGFKPIAKEFVAKLKENFSKGTMTGTEFTPWFAKKLQDEPAFRARWDEYVSGYEKFSEFFGRRFKYQGGGDYNLYKLFIEGDLAMLRPGGRLSLLVPSGLQTDEGCGPLRKLLLTEHCFEELTSFENRGYTAIEKNREKTKQIFPDVDSRFKFGFFKVTKDETPSNEHTFDGRFYLHDPKDVFARPIKYSVEMIRRFSPDNFGIMEFRTEKDYALCSKIRGEHPLLQSLGFRLSTEFHMTNDNHFFRKLTGKKIAGQLPLYEGKMIHQFDARYAPGNYAVVEKEVREELLRKEIHRLAKLVREVEPKKLEGEATPQKRDELDKRLREIFKVKKFKLQYEFPRTVYREIGRSTDERTIIATEVSADVCLNNKLPYAAPFNYELSDKGQLEQIKLDANELRSLLVLLNSLVLNFYLRSKISATLNMFYMYELPFPKLTAAQKKKLADFAGKLLQDPRAVAERAALEVFIARELYGLSLDDWKHLTGTFTFGGGDSKAELDEIIRQSLAQF